ncbi:glycosyltransferase [Bacillus sp. 2205SS5-2]|uniref:glycosyltransferase n=1 Tax=Bacillus sp. 2205SS5-2 TaxID=3109031 RepID=UPI0030077371
MIFILIGLLTLSILFTIVNIQTMPSLKRIDQNEKSLVSVLVPLRNEERNVPELIQTLKNLSYTHTEFLLLDDQSTDQTNRLLSTAIAGDNRFRLMDGVSLPNGWVGKVHACHRLASEAEGDYFFFLDADISVGKDAVQQALYLIKTYQSSMVSGFSHFQTKPFLAKLLVPFQHFFVFTLLPNLISNRTKWSAFTAAHGAFMFVESKAYQQVGGHKALKNSLLEDVHFARLLKKKGYRVTLANISRVSTCKMYETNQEVWQGFLKNIYIGLGKSPFAVGVFTLVYFTCYVLPLGLALAGFITGSLLLIVPLLLTFLQTGLVDVANRGERWHFLLTPFASATLIILLWASMIRFLGQQGVEWKGRTYL